MINNITLHNYKCFENQHLECRPLTLLAGLNGMGKSSALQALLLLRQSFQQGLLPGKGLALNGTLVCVGRGVDALYEDAKEEYIQIDLAIEHQANATWKFAYENTADILTLIAEKAPETIFRANLFSDDFHYLHAERTGPRAAFEMSEYSVRQHKQIGVHGEYTAHYLAAFGRNEVMAKAVLHEKASSNSLNDQVEAWLGEVSPGTRIRLNEHDKIDLVSVDYAFVTKKEVSAYYRSTNVGFGITYTLPLLTALIDSRPNSLILLENPEAHLHPHGQVKLGFLLARAARGGAQVLVETHSDHILNGIRVAIRQGFIPPEDVAIHSFGRDRLAPGIRSEVTALKIDREGRIDKWPEGFFDEWDRMLEALLQPRSE